MHCSTRVATLSLLPLLMYVCAPRASACGGFFCSNFPINQVAENVLFIQGEEAITAHIQLQFRTKPFAGGGGPILLPIGEPASAVVEHLYVSGPPTTIRRLTTVTETGEDADLSGWSLVLNYLNPFHSATVLPFNALRATTAAALHIYNLLSQRVHTLAEGPVVAGYNEICWDGRDQQGQFVVSGVYLYRLEVSSVELARKLLFLC